MFCSTKTKHRFYIVLTRSRRWRDSTLIESWGSLL